MHATMPTAIVVGAGIGGLAAAGALTRSGWHVTLLERGERLRGSGAAMLLWPGGLGALHELGLSVGDAAYRVPDAGIRRSDGKVLVPAQPHRPGPVVVHADDLHDALMAGLGVRTEIRTGVAVTGVRVSGLRPVVTTAKQDFEVDLVVGADGASSVIRRRLFPQAVAAPAGFAAWRAVIAWFRAPTLPDSLPPAGDLLDSSGGHRFSYAVLGDRGSAGASARGGIYWTATAPGAARPEPPATQLTLLRRWFDGWPAPVGELLAATEPDDLVQSSAQRLHPLPPAFGAPVGSGAVLLVGDAAHVHPPTVAVGAGLALQDAVALQEVARAGARGATLPAAVVHYTAARRPAALRAARSSHRVGLLIQARGAVAVRARDLILGRYVLPGDPTGEPSAATAR